MAHDGLLDDESASVDTQDTREANEMIPESKNPLEVELSFNSSASSPRKLASSGVNGRSKAVSAAAAPITFSINSQETADSNEVLHGFWNVQRRTQSDGNVGRHNLPSSSSIADNNAIPVTFLASPAHSESFLMIHNEKEGLEPLPPSVSVRAPISSKPQTFTAMRESLLAGMANLAGIKSPRGTLQKVHVVYPTSGPLYVDLYSRDDGTGAFVKGFRRKLDGSVADAEASGRVFPGDELVAIKDVDVTKMMFNEIIALAQEATFPLNLTFCCHQTKREEYEKQKTTMDGKCSSRSLTPVLPLMSPSNSAGWGAKLSQMTRSGSFDQKTSGTNLGNGVPMSPLLHSTATESNGGKFGISLGKVGTDGVKVSLFRMMGNKASRSEKDKNLVKSLMDDLALKPHNRSAGGRHRKSPANTNSDVMHSTPIVAVTTGGRFIGVLDEDVNEFALTWFRKTPPEMDIRQIKGVTRCPYFPSVDDVGAVLSLQCKSLRFPQLQRVVEMPRPLVLDPDVGNTVNVFLEAGAGSFSATLASNEHDSFQIKISAKSVTMIKISEEDGGVVVEAAYGPFLQVLLDPGNQLRFTLKVQEFGGFLGNREGDKCDLKKRQAQFETMSCFFLVAQNRQNRDILTLLIRKFRAQVIIPEQEEVAQVDERNLFMDPANAVAVARPAPLIVSQFVESHSGAVSPASNPVATGETASSTGSPTTVTTPSSGMASSPMTRNTCAVRLQSEGSLSSMSSARLSDLVGLEPDDSDQQLTRERESDLTASAATPSRAAMVSSKNEFGVSTNDIVVDNPFVEGRLAAQDKEIVMLREKLAVVSVRLKAAMQESLQITASLEVKDNRIESQQMKIRQIEKLAGQCDLQALEIQNLRTKLEDSERRHALCREELQQISGLAAKQALEIRDRGVQTEDQFLDGEGLAFVTSGSGWKRDAWSGTVATVSASDLQQQVEDQQVQIAQFQDEHVNLVAERNMFRAKSMELSRELRRLVRANNNRSLDDLKTQLAERTSLQVELASVKADAKKKEEELVELKCLLDGTGDKDKGAKRLATQNMKLQRTVHQLKDSLSEARDQVNAVKKINGALASRLHCLQPDTRGSIVEPASTSASTSLLPLSSDDEDDDDEEEDEELKDGIAEFRRSLVGK
ncbi:hypothetical protein DD237_007022 [Peronospora effusa]|uniref:PDZ domain-containing protein n=1 Tax=Peronospora effusa TaxID=542832 RepID=A0A3R7Y3E7_9STRA|nr:hypothetical protein DD237_007022 [Peronospora effusa]